MRSYNPRCIRYGNVPSRSFRLYTAVVSLSKTHKCLSCTGLSEKEGRPASLSASGSLWRSLTVYLVGKSGKISCANLPLVICPLVSSYATERDSCPLTASLGRPWGRVKDGGDSSVRFVMDSPDSGKEAVDNPGSRLDSQVGMVRIARGQNLRYRDSLISHPGCWAKAIPRG